MSLGVSIVSFHCLVHEHQLFISEEMKYKGRLHYVLGKKFVSVYSEEISVKVLFSVSAMKLKLHF